MHAADLNIAFEAANGLCFRVQDRVMCVDLDACIAAGRVDEAKQWISEIVRADEKAIIVGESLDQARQVLGRSAGMFFDRNKLPEASRAATGHALGRALTFYILQHLGPSSKVKAAQTNRSVFFSRLFTPRQSPATSPVMACPE